MMTSHLGGMALHYAANTGRPESAVSHCLVRWCTKEYLLERLRELTFGIQPNFTPPAYFEG